MMEYHSQLKLQSYLDGELSEEEIRKVEQWLASDEQGRALLEELKHTRSALAGFEAGVKLPESREFFWSKVQRQIEREARPEPARQRAPFGAAWRRFLMPAGATAGLAVALLLALISLPRSSNSETFLSDPGSFTYRDFDSGTTLVWFSYPSENEFAPAEPAGRLPER